MQCKTLNPHIPALKWGRQSKENARQDYKMEMKKNHVDFEIHTAGLLINTKYPFLGATPDGIVCYSCCGSGLLEVKCPYKYRDINPCEINDSYQLLFTNRARWYNNIMTTATRFRGKWPYGI